MRTVINLLILCFLTVGLGSCGGIGGCSMVRPDTDPNPPNFHPSGLSPVEDPKPGKTGKVDPLEQAKADQQKYAELSAQADKRVEVLTKQYNEASQRSQANWISGICLLLAAVAGVAAFIVPLGKKILVAAAVGFTTVAACAQAYAWAIPYLPWIGGTAIVGGGIWAAINWKKLGNAVQVAADHGDRVEDWLLDELPGDVRAKAEKIMNDAKVESKKQAESLGIHDQLQYLRGKTQTLWQRLFDKAE